MEVVK